jgi:hypothetical protein
VTTDTAPIKIDPPELLLNLVCHAVEDFAKAMAPPGIDPTLGYTNLYRFLAKNCEVNAEIWDEINAGERQRRQQGGERNEQTRTVT